MQKILEKAGYENEQADRFIEALIWSDLIGRSTHGIWRLTAYINRLQAKQIRCPCSPVITTDHQAVAVMDGDNGLGQFVGHQAMRLAISKAGQFGIGAVAVHNSNHFGTGAYFVHLAAQQNMIGLAFSNSTAKVAAFGGSKPVFGTNPFALSVPRSNGEHLLLDMSTSAVCGSQLMKYAQADLPLPEGIAVDTMGRPVSNTRDLETASLLPFGGAKGYGMALMVEIMSSVITGAMFSTHVASMFKDDGRAGGNGHFFIAIDLSTMMSLSHFDQRLEALLLIVRGSGQHEGDVLIPGETRWTHYKENIKYGIPVDDATLAALHELARLHGISLPAHASQTPGA